MIFAAASHSARSGEGVYNYGLVIFLMMTGLYLVLSKGNMIKSVIGLNLFQVSVIMFYVSMGRVEHGTAPILLDQDIPHHEESHGDDHSEEQGSLQTSGFSLASPVVKTTEAHLQYQQPVLAHYRWQNSIFQPLPHVLMLTAIVVGVNNRVGFILGRADS